METRQELQGKWNELKGKVREKWGDFTDDEFQKVRGDAEQLIGLIQQKSGAARREVEAFVDQVIHDGSSMIQQATETAKRYAGQATDMLRDGCQQAGEHVESGYEEAQEMVRSRPVESVGVAFGAGLIAGVAVALLLRSGRA